MSVSFRTKFDVPTIEATIAYVEKNGWQKTKSKYPNALAFHGPLDIYGKPLLLVLPARETLLDAELRLNDAMRTLAVLNATTPEQMAQTIKQSQMPTAGKPKPTLRRKSAVSVKAKAKPTAAQIAQTADV